MNPAKFRKLAALTWLVLLVDLVFYSPSPTSVGETAAPPAVDARRTEPTDRMPRTGIPKRQATAPAARAPLAFGEPEGRPELVRTLPGRSSPPRGSFATAFPAQAAATRSGALGGNSWALIVGINDYAGSTRDNIGSYQDAVALRTYLLGLGWRSDHILLLANRQATRTRIVQGLQWLASKTDSASTAVFHYSGHEKPYTSDVDGDSERRDVALWAADNRLLVDGDLGRLLGAVRASKMWLNFAVCRAGGFSDAGTVKAGRVVTYSSPESELSYEDPEVRHSVFGYFSIVEGMRSRYADANGDGITTIQEAFSYARPRVINRTGDRQHPTIVDRYGHSFSLVPPRPPANPAPKPSPSPTPCELIIGCDAKPEERF